VSIETKLHHYFKFKKIDGEWFSLTDEDIENFEKQCDKYYKTFEILEENTYIQDRNINFK
jgi:tRNA splicing ligase